LARMWHLKSGMCNLLEMLGRKKLIQDRKTSSGAFYARVLYSGQPLITVHGVLDWIALDDLIDNMAPYVPADIIALCNN